jgi:crotonobetainyl-CoA:carnitine CoA-transferase CaiB-like acyl-CoA transferase
MAGIFDGQRVVELATGIAAPYAGMLLADLGADVIKVEAGAGDPYRDEAGFHSLNRNKRSVRDVPLPPLLAGADVVLTDRPATAWALRRLAPRAVVVSVPPWGERGPCVDGYASPSLLAAACGMAWNQQSYTEGPVHLVVPLVPYATGPLVATAAAAGLLLRARTGCCPVYEVSQVAGAAAFQLEQFRVGDTVEVRPGDAPMGSKGRVPIYRLFRCADDRWLFMACGTLRFWERMLEVMDLTDLKGDPRLPSPPWGLVDLGAIAVLAPRLEAAFESKPRDEWVARLRAADIPVQPVQTREEFLASSLATSNELTIATEHPELGPLRIAGRPVRFEAGDGSLRRLAPRHGEHDSEVGAELGNPQATGRIPASQGGGQGGPPLHGVRVLDLASFIAGPVVSRHLAMLGADVIKVEAPTGDPFRAFGEPFAAWNQGKRSIALDLTTDADRAVLHRLVATVDVVVENFRPGVADKLGCAASTLRAINPQLIYLSCPGYGVDPELAGAAAFDPLLQALGGVMDAQGGGDEPVFLTPPLHDVMVPLLGAFGVVSALLHRQGGHGGQRVLTSLAHATLACQVAEVTRFAGSSEPPRGGFDFKGPGEQLGLVETGNGWEAVDGAHRVRVSTTGLINSDLAAANELTVTQQHPAFGELTSFGQLVRGAGVPPRRGPLLDEDRADVLAELERIEAAGRPGAG